MKVFLYRLLQWTWGFPQTLVGAIIYLTQRKNQHISYKGAIATKWHGHGGSVSLGMFLFLDVRNIEPQTEYEQYLIRHEFGHTVQSLMLGPFYLLVVGLPSIIWAGCFSKYRSKCNVSYDVFYPEKWANRLGARFSKEKRRDSASL